MFRATVVEFYSETKKTDLRTSKREINLTLVHVFIVNFVFIDAYVFGERVRILNVRTYSFCGFSAALLFNNNLIFK